MCRLYSIRKSEHTFYFTNFSPKINKRTTKIEIQPPGSEKFIHIALNPLATKTINAKTFLNKQVCRFCPWFISGMGFTEWGIYLQNNSKPVQNIL